MGTTINPKNSVQFVHPEAHCLNSHVHLKDNSLSTKDKLFMKNHSCPASGTLDQYHNYRCQQQCQYVHSNHSYQDVDIIKDVQPYYHLCTSFDNVTHVDDNVLISATHKTTACVRHPQPYHCNTNSSNNETTNNDPPQSVVNLSSLTLTPPMVSLLSKGLNFCPTPGEPDINNLKQDLDTFHTSLRRSLFFNRRVDSNTSLNQSTMSLHLDTTISDESGPFDHQKFKNPSHWSPKGPLQLESMIVFNTNQLSTIVPRAPEKQNLTKEEKKAMTDLKQNTDIVIKPADKGSAVVIQNKEDYIKEGLRQLNDQNFYQEVPDDLTGTHNEHVQQLIQNLLLKEEITEKCADYLHIEKPRTSQLYLLPKIHKNKSPVPGRPIVSANSSPTERISQLADFFLQPLVVDTKSYVKDTTDFINKIEAISNLSPETIMCTIDVTSLYTNIPNQEGIDACQKFLMASRKCSENPSIISILKLLQYVLTKNNFDFNGKHYLQVGGTAMGTKVAPSFAILFMADFEDKHVYTYPTQPKVWLRYIDDIFLIWEHGQEELQNFVEHLNSCHPTIKFTVEQSTEKVNFLDTTVHTTPEGTLYTDLYSKPTDSHNYLRFNSAHPSHCKTSLPNSQFLRLRRICTRIEDYDTNAAMLASHFIRRGYPQDLVENAAIKVRRIDRPSILADKQTEQQRAPNKELFLITTYNPQDNLARKIVDTNWPTLGRTNTTENLYNAHITYGYRRNKNLRDFLVQAKLDSTQPKRRVGPDDRPNPLNKCRSRSCTYCPHLDRSGTITSTTTGRTYQSKRHISCCSHNLIYCITCTICKKQYVGQTSKKLKERFINHFGNINNKRLADPIGRHFSSAGHTGRKTLTIHIVEFIPAPYNSSVGKSLRDTFERRWMYKLQSISPQGLNLAE